MAHQKIFKKENANSQTGFSAALSLQSRPFLPHPQSDQLASPVVDLLKNQPQTELQRQTSSFSLSHIRLFPPGKVSPPPSVVHHPLQAKLTLGQPNDKYEQEADLVAKKVVQQIRSPLQAQPQVNTIQTQQNRTLVQQQPIKVSPLQHFSLNVQRRGEHIKNAASATIENKIQQEKGKGRPLDEQIRQPMEQAMGADFSTVNIHTDTQSDALNRSVQAKAFTTGQDIFFKQGEYNPGSQAGKELIAHELTHVVQQRGIDSSTIQRRIGFEIETGIPITEKDDDTDTYQNIFVSDVGEDIAVPGGHLSVDHVPGHTATASEPFEDWPIIEFVSKPIDDKLSLDAFEVHARKWINKLKAVKTLAQSAPPAKQLKDNYHVGLPSMQSYDKWDRIAPQATAGVPLDQVGKVISAFDSSGATSHYVATQKAREAPGKAAKIMQDILDAYKPSPSDGAGVEGLKGLLVLMCNYLLAGGAPDIAKVVYMKNRPSNIFYKSKLSTVRNNIAKQTYVSNILGDVGGRALVRSKLLQATSRGGAEKLFIADPTGKQGQASDVTVSTWINEILEGLDDQIFDEMKNEWSSDIDPDADNEVVIELRKLGGFVSHTDFSLESDDGLLAFLKKVYGANQLYKTRQL